MKTLNTFDAHRIWLDPQSVEALREMQKEYLSLGIEKGRLTTSAMIRRAILTHRDELPKKLTDDLQRTREASVMWACTTRKGALGDTRTK